MNPPNIPPNNPHSYYEYYDAPDGKRYQWDPDYQCWYEIMTPEQWAKLSHWEKYMWLYVVIAVLIFSGWMAL